MILTANHKETVIFRLVCLVTGTLHRGCAYTKASSFLARFWRGADAAAFMGNGLPAAIKIAGIGLGRYLRPDLSSVWVAEGGGAARLWLLTVIQRPANSLSRHLSRWGLRPTHPDGRSHVSCSCVQIKIEKPF